MTERTLENHRRKLLEMRARLMDDIEAIVERLPEKVVPPGELSNVPMHNADRDSEGLDKEIILEANQEELLRAVEAALQRIDEGTYGICEDCGQSIRAERLEALPFTKHCTACAARREAAGLVWGAAPAPGDAEALGLSTPGESSYEGAASP